MAISQPIPLSAPTTSAAPNLPLHPVKVLFFPRGGFRRSGGGGICEFWFAAESAVVAKPLNLRIAVADLAKDFVAMLVQGRGTHPQLVRRSLELPGGTRLTQAAGGVVINILE